MMNADACFHHSQQSRRANYLNIPDEQLPVPQLPDECLLEVEETSSDVWWIVRDRKSRNIVSTTNEKYLRFSVSCKFHIFRDEAELLKYESKEKKLTAENIIDVLVEDLKAKKKLPNECESKTMPLYKLAPIFVREYILPLAPTSENIQAVWEEYFSKFS